MKFKEFLRRVIGGRLHGDRLHIFRTYFFEVIKAYEGVGYTPPEEKTDEGRLKKVNAVIERFARDGVDQMWFNNLSARIPAWRKEKRIQQRRNAANIRWQKKYEKSLDGDKNPSK